MTLHLTRYFGLQLRVMPDANGRRRLCGVAWYPRSRGMLGYLYF